MDFQITTNLKNHEQNILRIWLINFGDISKNKFLNLRLFRWWSGPSRAVLFDGGPDQEVHCHFRNHISFNDNSFGFRNYMRKKVLIMV